MRKPSKSTPTFSVEYQTEMVDSWLAECSANFSHLAKATKDRYSVTFHSVENGVYLFSVHWQPSPIVVETYERASDYVFLDLSDALSFSDDLLLSYSNTGRKPGGAAFDSLIVYSLWCISPESASKTAIKGHETQAAPSATFPEEQTVG